MGILSDFVLASDDELRGALVSWRKVASEPRRVRRRGVNPFTKKPFDVEAIEWTADPSEPDPVDSLDLSGVQLSEAVTKALKRVPDPTGNILLANRLSVLDEQGLCRLPRLQLKSITTLELASLSSVVLGDDGLAEELERPALIPPDAAKGERWVHRIPARLVSVLAQLDAAALDATAAAWAGELKWATEDALFVLSGLHDLCVRATQTDKSVFLHGGL